jgi:hypothetical protein
MQWNNRFLGSIVYISLYWILILIGCVSRVRGVVVVFLSLRLSWTAAHAPPPRRGNHLDVEPKE